MMYNYPQYGETPVKITERGWGGHFCLANQCLFRRNTLLEFGNEKWVVSTVGNRIGKSEMPEEIGYNRYYETMAFVATEMDGYYDADVTQQIAFDSPWTVSAVSRLSDAEAQLMHDAVVFELSKAIQLNVIRLIED
jgi:hypothetical protein